MSGGTGLNLSEDGASGGADLLDELCAYLQQMGIGAKVAWDDPSPEAVHYHVTRGTYGRVEAPLGCIEVEGRSIDAIRICLEWEAPIGYGNIDHWPFLPTGSSYRLTFNISYFVHCIVEDLEDSLKAETRPIKGGLFAKKVIGLEWKGGRLAGILNADSDLKAVLLKTGPSHIAISLEN
jgi:hypothetical protein